MITFCRDCQHVHEATRKSPPYKWLCVKHKRLEGAGFVDPEYWTKNEPYLRCQDVNGGVCPLFESLRNA